MSKRLWTTERDIRYIPMLVHIVSELVIPLRRSNKVCDTVDSASRAAIVAGGADASGDQRYHSWWHKRVPRRRVIWEIELAIIVIEFSSISNLRIGI
jgi:hypothetical protein